MTRRALIVEDEELARLRLRRLLERHPDIEVVGEAASIEEAATALRRLRPDLLFLDIRLRGGYAFELLRRVAEPPPVIFTTAYDQFALRAFETTCLDYLLKPIEPADLDRALGKLRRWSGAGLPEIGPRLERLVGELAARPAEHTLRRLGCRLGDRTRILSVDDITHFQAEDKVVFAHLVSGRRHIVDRSLIDLEQRLDPRQFVRIHRSTLVNIDHVSEIERWFAGRLRVRLADAAGTVLTASKGMAGNLKRMIDL